jgi:hypothetical protein
LRALQLSGLSRNSPRPGLFGRPSNSATKNGPCTFSVQEPLLLIPSGETSAQENQEARAAGESRRRPCFSTEPLLLSPSGPRPVAGHEVRRSRSPRVAALLEGTTFTHAFPARPAPRKTKRPGPPEGVAGALCFSTEPLLLSPSGPRPVAGHEVRRSRSPRVAALLEGTTFTHAFPARPAPRKTKRSGLPESRRTVFSTEPLLLIPSGAQTRAGHEVRRSRSPRVAALLEGTNFLLMPSRPAPRKTKRSGLPESRRTVFSTEPHRRESPHFVLEGTTFTHAFPVRLAPRKPGDRARRGGATLFFRGNHFPSFLPAETSQPRQPVDRRLWDHHTFLRGNHFSSFPLFHGCPLPRT